MKIIAEYSDYSVNAVEYIIDKLNEKIANRDIAGLSNNRIEIINITKEHPLVSFIASRLNPNSRGDVVTANIVPAISVTPVGMTEEAVSFGENSKEFACDNDVIGLMKSIAGQKNKEIQAQGLITATQAEAILAAHKKGRGVLRGWETVRGYNEEVNISCWSQSPDEDTLLIMLVESALGDLSVGLPAEQGIRNVRYRITRGLTNFNFGRVLYGSEASLTFLNLYRNFKVFEEELVMNSETNFAFKTSGR